MGIVEGIVVCSNELKRHLLNNMFEKGEMNYYKFYTIEEFKKNMLFSFEKKTLLYVKNLYKCNFNLANDLLESTYYVEDVFYGNSKLDSIVQVKKELEKKKLLIKNDLFYRILSRYPVTFVNCQKTKEVNKLIEIARKYTSVYFYNYEQNVIQQKLIYEFKNIDSESRFVFSEIYNLLSKGIPYEDIYIVNYSKDYDFVFRRLMKFYGIEIDLGSDLKYNDHIEYNSFFNLLVKEKNFSDIVSSIKDLNFAKVIARLINEYGISDCNPADYKSLFEYELSRIKCKNKVFRNAIKTVSTDYVFKSSDHVFYIGFNNETTPRIITDDAFLSNRDRLILGLDDINELNSSYKVELINKIKSMPNLVISYKLKGPFSNYLPSLLINDLGLKVLNYEVKFGDSKAEDNLRFSLELDEYDKYNVVGNNINKYNIGDVSYRTFDNSFKMDKKIYEKYLNGDYKFSYSTLKELFSCPFSFYINNVLSLKEFDGNLATRLGSFSHKLLDESYETSFDFDKNVLEGIKDAKDAKELFYFDVQKDVVKRIIDFNREHESLSDMNNVLREQLIEIKLGEFSLKGFVDKILYTVLDNDVFVAIIDYKTGRDQICLDNIEYGFNLQLPIYMYLIKHSNIFAGKNIHIVGVYLQKVEIKKYKKGNKSIENQEKDACKLQGYTTSNRSYIMHLDKNFIKSDYIDKLGVKKTDNEFYAYSKIFTDEDEKNIDKITDELLNKAINNYLNADFSISPKLINDKDVSCQYCLNRDLCFREFSDYVSLVDKKFKVKGEDSNGLD